MADRGFKGVLRPICLGVIACVLINGLVGANATGNACEVCHCDRQSLTVDCSTRGLTKLPTGIPNDTAILDLSVNFLREIPEDWLMQFPRLIFLKFSSNLISKPFRVPPLLLSLLGDDNHLQDIRMFLINGHKLQRVSFRRNNLEIIRRDTFRNCTDLVKLRLDENKIGQIEPGGLFTSKYTMILLNFNRIAELSPVMFGGGSFWNIHIIESRLTRIKSFTLGGLQHNVRLFGNNIQELPDGLFSDKTDSKRELNRVDFSNNHIREVSPTAFKGVNRLGYLSFAANKLKDESLPNDLFANLKIGFSLDLSMNELSTFPRELLRNQSDMFDLYIQRNHITTLDETMFKGFHSLVSLHIYQNPIKQLADFQFYETSLRYLVMFQGNLSEVGVRPFATEGDTLQQILMHGNPIKHIKDTIWPDLGPDCYVSVDKSLRQAPNMVRTDIIVDLVGDNFIPSFDMRYSASDQLSPAGLECLIVSLFERQCKPCGQGTYGVSSSAGCTPCPPGGFYQSVSGQYSENETMKCEICNIGTYVSPEASPGKGGTDCKVCPTGTDKSTTAGFRACPCVDNYYRTDRFGECHQCPHEGLNCSGEYQHLLPGYWWTWNWTSQEERISQENHDSYMKFVNNICIMNDSYDRSAQRFGGKLPQVHKCSRDDVCPNGGIGIDSTCSEGYKGWLCSECANKYYSWLGHCLECPEWPLFAVEVFCILLAVCIIVGFFVWDAYRRHRRNERNIVSIFLARGKIVVGFCQVMGEIFSALDDIPWPRNLQTLGSVFKTMEVSLVGWLISPRCFIPDFTYPNIYIEFLVGFGFIIAVVLVACCYYASRKRHLTTAQGLSSRFRDDLNKSKQRCFLIVVILLFLSYPSVCSVIISLLPTGCKLFYMDEDKELNITLLRYDYAIDCESPEHNVYNYAAQTAMVYVVGFPLALFILLWYSKSMVNNGKDEASVSSQGSDQVLPSISNDRMEDTEAPVSSQNSDQVLPSTSNDGIEDTEAHVSSQNSDQVLPSTSNDGLEDTEAPVSSQNSDQVLPDTFNDGIEDTEAHVSSQSSAQVLLDPTLYRTDDTDDLATESEGTDTDTLEPDTKISWDSFLCENYKAEFWYWEIIELTRKILQTLFILLFGPEDHFTLFVSVFLSVFFLLIHAYLKPMKDAAEQRLQMCSLGIIFINMLAASLLLMPNDYGPIVEDRKGVLAMTLVLLNISIIVFVALSSVWTGIKVLSRHGCFACIKNSLVQMCRWCRRRYRKEQEGHGYLLDDEHPF
ncbi:uncharacterized protein LOC117299491 [Asterias rubens]|uniref:uncharacterized protein LOC117299491 n=1 Tax=Asterias rubens TaxID=7604 RepID=UPI00145571AE|nr:uncharacterized protein LOC117299491 [Asterias rubens]